MSETVRTRSLNADDTPSGARIYRNDAARWKAVISRDRAADGQFVYAEPGGKIVAGGPAIGDWEPFRMTFPLILDVG